jgi:hypothetical protein
VEVVLGWKREGLLEAKRGDLLKVLQARFPPEVPADLAQAIQQTRASLSRRFRKRAGRLVPVRAGDAG